MTATKPPSTSSSTTGLRCVQCHVTETPLWRAGPAGPKTLCNACGVRYRKHGVLTPRGVGRRGGSRGVSKSGGRGKIKGIKKKNDTRGSGVSRGAASSGGKVGVVKYSLAGGKRYESIFSGLMVVQRSTSRNKFKGSVGESGSGSLSVGGVRKRSKTAKGKAYDEERRKEFKERTTKRLMISSGDDDVFLEGGGDGEFGENEERGVGVGDSIGTCQGYGGLSLLLAAAAKADSLS